MSATFSIADSVITIREPRPLAKLYVEINADCNLDCPMCFRRTFTGALLPMSDVTLDLVIQQLSGLPGLQQLVIAGIGEPLMHPRILELVRAGADAGAKVWVQTNGVFATSEMLLKLAKAGLDVLVVSHDADTSDHAVGHPTRDVIFRVAARLRELRTSHPECTCPRLAMETVLTAHNLPMLAESVARARDAGVSEVVLTNLLPTEAEQNSETLALRGYDEMLNDFLVEVEHRVQFRKPRFQLQTERHCDFVERRALVIRSDGAVAPCYRFLHDGYEAGPEIQQELKAVSFGNVHETSIDAVWQSSRYQEFRFRVGNWLFPSCPDCTFRGGCSFLDDTSADCWGNEPSCASCLWSRQIYLCP